MKTLKIFAATMLCFVAACSNEDLNKKNVFPEESDWVNPYIDRMYVIADLSKDCEATFFVGA
jgi:hypothetical protein